MGDKVVNQFSISGFGEVYIYSRTNGGETIYQAEVGRCCDGKAYGISGSKEETIELAREEIVAEAEDNKRLAESTLEKAANRLNFVSNKLNWTEIKTDEVKADEAVTNSE